MTATGPRPAARVLLAAVVSLALVLAAPWLGELRSLLRRWYPDQVGLILNVGVAVLALAGVVLAVRGVRERRVPRFSLMGLALVLAASSAAWTATDSATVNAAERFHFVAYGLVTLLFYRAFRRPDGDDLVLLAAPVVCAFIVALADEAFQWYVPGRVGEIRDVGLNAAAIAAGLVFSLGALPPRRLTRHVRPSSWRRLATAVAVASIALAAFLQMVHLGTLVEDADGLAFRSRYSAATLRVLAGDRADRWAHDPPPASLVRFSREDQYLAEGVWHVQARNAAWESDIRRAWSENLILERYFGPVLDTPSWAIPERSRWPDAQRADAEERAGAGPPVASRADLIPIFTANPGWIWAPAVALALIVLGLAARRGPDGRPI
ncbi:MAG: VanZ family protein [Vicinamibacterales bacterium]